MPILNSGVIVFRTISTLVIVGSLAGCSMLPRLSDPAPYVPPEVKVVTEQVRMPIYQPPLPAEIRLENVQWYVITENNLEEKIAEIESFIGGEFVVFAMTPQGYENMAYNMQEIRRYIRQQKEVILYYRSATQEDTGTTAQDWIEINEQQQPD